MLDERERRIWDDVLRHWSATAPEPTAAQRAAARVRVRRGCGDEPGWVVAGGWTAVFLVLFGAVAAGLALAAATALGWALWRHRPRPAGTGDRAGGLPVTGEAGPGGTHPGEPLRDGGRWPATGTAATRGPAARRGGATATLAGKETPPAGRGVPADDRDEGGDRE
ncbi:hypothetical protein SAMN05660690_3694 [Geodermatophilus telluris]|uniref:DUF3040 domain-containing protein n=1 Tax=Geodermatophilus telluris TaxID=1190417 RepID=A0A1G6SZU1_9ACTN|nr:hypothetical protein [Geodermatophilus telluris]SDD22279.1 hypothetical protein SAMN05660690_3694 [Geodermatophilus telluris]